MSCSVFDKSTSAKKLNKGYVDKTSSHRNVLDFRFIVRELINIMKPPSDLYSMSLLLVFVRAHRSAKLILFWINWPIETTTNLFKHNSCKRNRLHRKRDDHISPGFQESRHSDSANKQREMDQIHFNFVKIVRCISSLKVEKQGLFRLQGRRSTPPLFHDKVTYMTLKQEKLKPQSR